MLYYCLIIVSDKQIEEIMKFQFKELDVQTLWADFVLFQSSSTVLSRENLKIRNAAHVPKFFLTFILQPEE